jgi:hypothetical protein
MDPIEEQIYTQLPLYWISPRAVLIGPNGNILQ